MLRVIFTFVGGLSTLFFVLGLIMLLTSGAAAAYAVFKIFTVIFGAFIIAVALGFAMYVGMAIGTAMYDEFFGDNR